MTELMKRYEAETGESLEEAKERWKTFAFYSRYIAWLEDQLRWRPVSEKPEKEGWYLCKVLYIDDTIGEETVHFDGERFVFGNVVKWLPIPPEGE